MTTNFLQFDTDQSNMLTDSAYNASSVRTAGVGSGLAASALHNKLFFQASTMVTAIANVLSELGYTVLDNNLSDLEDVIKDRLQYSQVRDKTSGTTDTVLDSDRNGMVTYSVSASMAVTLPAANSAGFENAYKVTLVNRGTGVVTITPTTSTIDGAASITLSQYQSVDIYSDNTNYFTARGRSNPITRNVTAAAAASCPFALGTGPGTLFYGWSKVNTDSRNQFLQFSSDTGVNYLAANYRYANNGRNDADSAITGVSTSAAGILLNGATAMGSDTGEYMGVAGLILPRGSTSNLKAGAVGMCITQSTAGVLVTNLFGGIYTGTAANMDYARLVDTAGGNVTSNLTIQDL